MQTYTYFCGYSMKNIVDSSGNMKKALILGLGVIFIVLAIVFFVIPGPSIIFVLAALVCFSIYYPKARIYLKKVQILLTRTCRKLDGFKE